VVKQAEVDENTVKVFQRLEEHGGAVNTCTFYGSHLIASGSGLVLISFMTLLMTELFVIHTCMFHFDINEKSKSPYVE